MNQARCRALLDGLTYAALTILVWGVNALQRGLWQDDVQALGEAFRRSLHVHFVRRLFGPDASPLRRLTVLPSAIANATPHPIWALHFLCGAIWLAHGLLAGWIVGLLLPGRRWTRFGVVCLTLTATSDFTTGSMVALAYNLAALFILAATGCALLWLGGGRIVALVASAILLLCSLLTMDVALPAVPFLLLLFVSFGVCAMRRNMQAMSVEKPWATNAAGHAGRRVAALLIAWGVVLVPIAIVEWSFLHDPTSYAAMALLPLSKRLLVTRTITLWLDNFAPWRWAFARPEWYARPRAVIPSAWMAIGSLFAASLFLLRARTKDDDATADDGRRSIFLAALFATMALATNAAYASVWFSEFHYRTHILSRVWASMAIGILAGWAGTRAPRLRWAAVGIVTAFIFFGTWGGMERQDFFLGTWRQHQRELASILNAAPSLRPGTVVILRGSRARCCMATEADYLTKHWLRLLYDDPKLRAMRIDPQWGGVCQPTADGLDCRPEGTPEPNRVRYEELVVMDYDSRSGTYSLVRSLGDERYHPEKRIIARPWTLRQQRLLLTSPGKR